MNEKIADIIVPVYDEAENLPEFFKRVQSLRVFSQLRFVFVDNFSEDNSIELIRAFIKRYPQAILIQHKKNEGYGSSLIDGMRAAITENIIIIDADCEYPPETIMGIIESLQKHEVVYASRFLNKHNAKSAGMTLLKWSGNRIISGLFNLIFAQQTSDLYTGCKGMKTKLVQSMPFQCKGFEHVLELAARLSVRGYRIVDIPVDFSLRQEGQSKMRHISETLKYVILLIYYRLRRKNI